VRCARCQHTWFQEPGTDLPTPIPVPVEEPEQLGPITDRGRMLGPPPAPEPDYGPEPEAFTQPFDPRPSPGYEPLSAPPEQMVPRQQRRPVREQGSARYRGMVGLVAGVSILSLFLVIFFSMPRDIANFAPATVSIYNALGIEVNRTGFDVVATQGLDYANSIPIIVIKGELVNVTDTQLSAPSIRIAVRDKQGKELHHWVVRPDKDSVGPRGKSPFSARLESPPAESYDLEFRLEPVEER